MKKFGHEQRKTLPCPKSGRYNFVATQKENQPDEQNHTDSRAPTSSTSQSFGMRRLPPTGATAHEGRQNSEGERNGKTFCAVEHEGLRSGSGWPREAEGSDAATVISFKGCLDTLRQFADATCGAEDKPRTISALVDEMLLAIARDLNPHRPGRSEPRVKNRRSKNYRLLTKTRHKMGPLPHRKGGVEKNPKPRLS